MKPYRALSAQCLLVFSLVSACGDDSNGARSDAGGPADDAGRRWTQAIPDRIEMPPSRTLRSRASRRTAVKHLMRVPAAMAAVSRLRAGTRTRLPWSSPSLEPSATRSAQALPARPTASFRPFAARSVQRQRLIRRPGPVVDYGGRGAGRAWKLQLARVPIPQAQVHVRSSASPTPTTCSSTPRRSKSELIAERNKSSTAHR